MLGDGVEAAARDGVAAVSGDDLGPAGSGVPVQLPLGLDPQAESAAGSPSVVEVAADLVGADTEAHGPDQEDDPLFEEVFEDEFGAAGSRAPGTSRWFPATYRGRDLPGPAGRFEVYFLHGVLSGVAHRSVRPGCCVASTGSAAMSGSQASPPPAANDRSPRPMYAIVKTGGKQYKVAEGDVIEVEKLDGEPGDAVTLPAVLLVDGDGLGDRRRRSLPRSR